MAKDEPPSDSQPSPMDDLLRTKALIEQGVEDFVDVPAFQKAGQTPAEAAAEGRENDLEAYAALVTLGQGQRLPEDNDMDMTGHFLPSRRSRLLGLGLILLLFTIAVAVVAWRLAAAGGSPASRAAGAPASISGQTATSDQPTPASTSRSAPAAPTPSPSAESVPDTWAFTGTYGLDVTLTLVPKGASNGSVSVAGEPDATGTYAWNGSTLRIAYRQPVTLLNGNVVDTRGRFTCTGRPTSPRLRCTIRALAWTSTSTSQHSQWLDLTATGRPLQR